MSNRADLEQVENGFTVRVFCEDQNKDEYGYTEPETFVAKTLDEALKLIKENLKLENEKGDM